MMVPFLVIFVVVVVLVVHRENSNAFVVVCCCCSFIITIERPRSRVDQPKIKSWKFHALHKK